MDWIYCGSELSWRTLVKAVMDPHIPYSAWNVLMLLDSRLDMQSVRNMTGRQVSATTVPVKSKEYYTFWVCVCSLRCPACNEHAPYFPLCPNLLYKNISYYTIKGTIFEKKNTEQKMCVLIFSTIFVWNISHIKTNWARYDQKCMLGTRYSSQVLVEFNEETEAILYYTTSSELIPGQILWLKGCNTSCGINGK